MFFVPWICSGWTEPASPSEGFWIIRLEGVLSTVLIPQYRSGDTARKAIPSLSGANTTNCCPWNCSMLACLAWRCAVPVSASYPVALAAQIALVRVSAVRRFKWLVLCDLPCRALAPVLSMPVPPRGARVQLLFFVVPVLSDRFWSAFQLCWTALSQGLHLFQQWDEHSCVLGFPASLSCETSPLRCFVGCTGLLSALVRVPL